MKMTQEFEQIEQRRVSHWESKVECISAVSLFALAKKVTDFYAGKFVVGTQVFKDDKYWCALVYWKVKGDADGEHAVYQMRQRVP